MIVLHDAQDQSITYPLIVDDDKWFILHKLDGEDELEFELSLEDPMTAKIFEEMLVDANGNQYVVKNVDEHSNFMTVTCIVNLDDFKAQFHEHVLYRNAYLYDVLSDILPTGWSLAGDVSLSRKATIGSDDGVATYDNLNSYDVLFLAQTAYGVTFNFNAITKTLTVIDRSEVQSSGSYLMEDLNLESVGYVGSTKDFATRLYAYGKIDENTGNPLTFASINGGKEYVEDHSYSNKVISIGWTDERYTVKENLLADARKKLAALATPSRSYACKAKNVLDDVYVTKVITLVDKRRQQRVDHMVVEWKEYSRSDMDVITLSKSEPSITRSLGDQFKELRREVGMGDTMMRAFVNDAIENATDAITGNNGGIFKWIFDAQGRPIELLNIGDTYDPSTAQKVWRWNAAGLGHSNTGYNGTYELALLADGSINASVITTGVLNADIIRAGRIQDVTASNYWDLETGVMQFSKGRITSADGKNYWEVQSGALHVERGEIGGYTIESDKIYNDHVELDASGLRFYAYDANDEVKYEVGGIWPGRLVSQLGDFYGQLEWHVPVQFNIRSYYPYDQTDVGKYIFQYNRANDEMMLTATDVYLYADNLSFRGHSTSLYTDVKGMHVVGSITSHNKIGDFNVTADGLDSRNGSNYGVAIESSNRRVLVYGGVHAQTGMQNIVNIYSIGLVMRSNLFSASLIPTKLEISKVKYDDLNIPVRDYSVPALSVKQSIILFESAETSSGGGAASENIGSLGLTSNTGYIRMVSSSDLGLAMVGDMKITVAAGIDSDGYIIGGTTYTGKTFDLGSLKFTNGFLTSRPEGISGSTCTIDPGRLFVLGSTSNELRLRGSEINLYGDLKTSYDMYANANFHVKGALYVYENGGWAPGETVTIRVYTGSSTYRDLKFTDGVLTSH